MGPSVGESRRWAKQKNSGLAGEGLVPQRPLQRLQRGVLPLVESGEALGFFAEVAASFLSVRAAARRSGVSPCCQSLNARAEIAAACRTTVSMFAPLLAHGKRPAEVLLVRS